jgi:hypothetical protein
MKIKQKKKTQKIKTIHKIETSFYQSSNDVHCEHSYA